MWEVKKYDENDDDETGRDIPDEIAVQVADQERTRTFTATNSPFTMEIPRPANIFNKNQTEFNFLNFFSQNFW